MNIKTLLGIGKPVSAFKDETPHPWDQPSDHAAVRGFFRLHITEDKDGEEVIVGDSGWNENLITNDGFNNFLCKLLGALSGSIQVSYAALGTSSAGPAAGDTTLGGEVAKRAATTAATSNTSKAVQFTASFLSSASFLAGTSNISVIGLFGTSSGGTIFAGTTFASSSCATNQNVNVTYTISFT